MTDRLPVAREYFQARFSRRVSVRMNVRRRNGSTLPQPLVQRRLDRRAVVPPQFRAAAANRQADHQTARAKAFEISGAYPDKQRLSPTRTNIAPLRGASTYCATAKLTLGSTTWQMVRHRISALGPWASRTDVHSRNKSPWNQSEIISAPIRWASAIPTAVCRRRWHR